MMVPASVFLILISGAAPTLPTAEPQSLLAPPNPHRLRITVTRGAVSVRPMRGVAETQVTALKGWAVPAADLSGKLIVSLHTALQPAPPEGDLPERFFSTAVNGWAELWFDRATPYALAMMILYTLVAAAQAIVPDVVFAML
ncbi:MAG: hypothetical protein Q8L48_35060 [Archangium sp.]|nr:hypothetical protein [Archangium sp.]